MNHIHYLHAGDWRIAVYVWANMIFGWAFYWFLCYRASTKEGDK